MNAKLYKAASEPTADQLRADRGAFFGSVLGTLNHIVVADRIWLQRFAEHFARNEALSQVRLLPKPLSLDETLFPDFNPLSQHRTMLDEVIERWVRSLTDADLDQVLCYARSDGTRLCKRFAGLLLHFFNHQTHHRGQITRLLSQFGKDVGVTDLSALLPEEEKT
jgi:uncharacterized damage-inducible protein DinB